MFEYIVIDFCMSNFMPRFTFFKLINEYALKFGCIVEYRINHTNMSIIIKPNNKGDFIKPFDGAKIFTEVLKIAECYLKADVHFEFYRVEFVPALPF